MTSHRSVQGIAIVASICAVSASAAIDPNSTCEAANAGVYAWMPPVSNTIAGVASAPAVDTPFAPAKQPSTSFLSQGHSVFAIRNVADRDGLAGSIRWTWTTTSAPNAPLPVLPSHGKEVVFVTTADGSLHKIAADGTEIVSSDTRRTIGGTLICNVAPGDGIAATPAVQLYDFSSNAFRSALNNARHRHDDLVFVITADGCGDTTRNRIIAFWASDLTVAWTFNADAAVKVDRGSACVVDYATDSLFCTTDLQSIATGQDSLFALDTATGQLKWSHNAGALLNRPLLAGGKLYVASKPGTLQAFDPGGNGFGGGLAVWSSPLFVATPGTMIAKDIASFVLGANTYLLTVDTGGTMTATKDLGSSGMLWWNAAPDSGVSFMTAAVVAPSLGKAYVGRDDGRIQQVQLGLFDFHLEGVVTVDADFGLGDPTLDSDPGSSTPNRLVVAGNRGKTTRINLPTCSSAPF